MDDAARWVAEHGGVSTEGGLSVGLDALEAALAEGRFGADRERVVREYVRITRERLELIRQLDRETREDEAIIRQAQKDMGEKDVKRAELAIGLLGVRAAQSQAESARRALRVSWLALGVSLAAIALTAFDLFTRAA
jgi:hypothetical protein